MIGFSPAGMFWVDSDLSLKYIFPFLVFANLQEGQCLPSKTCPEALQEKAQKDFPSEEDPLHMYIHFIV